MEAFKSSSGAAREIGAVLDLVERAVDVHRAPQELREIAHELRRVVSDSAPVRELPDLLLTLLPESAPAAPRALDQWTMIDRAIFLLRLAERLERLALRGPASHDAGGEAR